MAVKKIEYSPKGVCARNIVIELDDDTIKEIRVLGGCPGNSLGVAALCKDEKVNDVIKKLKGITCGMKKTSCPDQIALALENEFDR